MLSPHLGVGFMKALAHTVLSYICNGDEIALLPHNEHNKVLMLKFFLFFDRQKASFNKSQKDKPEVYRE